MTCSSCNYQLTSKKSGFIICPNCGAVNISEHPDKPSYAHHSGVHVAPRSQKKSIGQILHKNFANVILATGVVIVLFGGIVAAITIPGQHHKVSTAAKVTHVTKKPIASKPATTQPPVVATTTPAKPAVTAPAAKPAPQASAPQPSINQIVASINQSLARFGVTATLSPPNNSYTYSTWTTLTSADVNNLQTFSAYLTQEFGKYPTDLVVNSGLKTIGLVKGLIVSGGPRAAAPAPSITGMLYDVNVMTNAGSAYAREVVSHEYWHYLDYKAHGSYTYDDSTWDACNPSGFSYGNGGITAYNPDSGYVAAFHPSPGFITAYSKYAIEEDRAEMFGWLIYSPSSVKSLNDGGINCKINRLTTLVHQLSPEMAF